MANAKQKGQAQARRSAQVAEAGPARGAGASKVGAGHGEPAPRKSKKRPRKPAQEIAAKTSAVAEDARAHEALRPAPKPRRARGAPVDLAQAIVQAAATNERLNQYLLEHLDARLWTVKPVEGRTIAAMVSHMHNVRHMWLAVSAREFPAPAKLDRRTVTLAEARAALTESALALRGLLERSLEAGGKVKDFRPDIVGFLAYLVAHDAHHRGQICLLARQLGMPLEKQAGYGMWDWNKRWQETQVPDTGR